MHSVGIAQQVTGRGGLWWSLPASSCPRGYSNTHTRARSYTHTVLFSRTNINSQRQFCLPAQKGSLWSCGAVATLSRLKNHQPDFGSISVNLRAHSRTMFFDGQSQAILSLRRIFEIRGLCVCVLVFFFEGFLLIDPTYLSYAPSNARWSIVLQCLQTY